MRCQIQINRIFLFLLLVCPFLSQADPKNLEPIYPLVEYLAALADQHHADPSKHAPIVAIGGCPGVGKTFLTQMLANALDEREIRCSILLFDDFILSSNERKKIGTLWDMQHFKGVELHVVLSSIVNGDTLIEKQVRNPLTSETSREAVDLSGVDLILFDGLYSLCSLPPINYFDYCSAGIFVEADTSDIYQWRWERELIKTVPRTPEQFNEIMEAYFNDYHENIEYSKANAAFIIQKDSEHHYILECKQVPQDHSDIAEAA